MRTLQQIQQLFPKSTIETGLPKEAVFQSRQAHGSNSLRPLPREPLWKKFIEKFDEPIIKILLAAALLSMFVDLFKVEKATAGVCFGIVAAAIAGLFFSRQVQWVPTALFVSAFTLFFIGLVERHFLVEGLAVMIAVSLATGV